MRKDKAVDKLESLEQFYVEAENIDKTISALNVTNSQWVYYLQLTGQIFILDFTKQSHCNSI